MTFSLKRKIGAFGVECTRPTSRWVVCDLRGYTPLNREQAVCVYQCCALRMFHFGQHTDGAYLGLHLKMQSNPKIFLSTPEPGIPICLQDFRKPSLTEAEVLFGSKDPDCCLVTRPCLSFYIRQSLDSGHFGSSGHGTFIENVPWHSPAVVCPLSLMEHEHIALCS